MAIMGDSQAVYCHSTSDPTALEWAPGFFQIRISAKKKNPKSITMGVANQSKTGRGSHEQSYHIRKHDG